MNLHDTILRIHELDGVICEARQWHRNSMEKERARLVETAALMTAPVIDSSVMQGGMSSPDHNSNLAHGKAPSEHAGSSG